MRILGITLPDHKQIQYALTAVYGIGLARAQDILDDAKIAHDLKAGDLTEAQEAEIRKGVEAFTLEGDLKREVSRNIKRLKDIKNYRGVRHILGLPVRGQRTKTNSRTVRGNKRSTAGSGRVKVSKT